MNHNWNNVYDVVKDRRYARLFFNTLWVVLGMVLMLGILSANLDADQLEAVCAITMPVVILMAMGMAVRWIRLERKYRREKLNHDALSRDELAKARLRLKRPVWPVRFKTQVKSTSRTTPRALDTYLKY